MPSQPMPEPMEQVSEPNLLMTTEEIGNDDLAPCPVCAFTFAFNPTPTIIYGIWLFHAVEGSKWLARKFWGILKANPFWSLAAILGTFGCSLLCPYFGTMIAGGLVWWCVKRQ